MPSASLCKTSRETESDLHTCQGSDTSGEDSEEDFSDSEDEGVRS